ncbi:DUF4304 domain-containing protein [Bacillus mangrovi]|uniref:DUF4304 domain-containing protein n=1 Tax=Metabacillus mangrovi TaxID=1491830 RepID=A0A7X2V566_9BACI|nr:DUF4304 domain-containing protein [Metabacillus mangrovi]MTH53834.1 DUF4304 domain-containing protein [Metabacillus mangrovi]
MRKQEMENKMLNAQEVLKQMIKDDLAPLFKAEGFKKKGNHFAKSFSDFAWTVTIQSSRWNNKEDVEFTINTGIFTDKLFGPFYKEDPPKFPTEVYSLLRLRVSELKKIPDTWYKINLSNDADQVRREVKSDIQNVIFPHFEKFHTIQDVIQEMKNKEEQGWYECPHFLTILYKSYGYTQEAEERMRKVHAESELEPQKEFTEELAACLGLAVK